MDSSANESAILVIDDNSSHGSGHRLAAIDVNSAQNELQFHSFIPSTTQTTTTNTKTSSVYSSATFDDNNTDEEDILLGQSPDKSSKYSSVGFWRLEYFGQYFDVTTNEVLQRILWSSIPTLGSKKGNYVERHLQSGPDLYGPVWISITLVFATAICGNVANYVKTLGDGLNATHEEWHYDYTKVGLAASTIFTYVLAVPVCLWFLFWFRGCVANYSLLETICIYGYSLSIYVPISILWVINIRLIQLILLSIGAILSGSVLVLTFAPVVQSDPSKTIKTSYLILIIIILIHAFLAFTFLQYFF
ncbi:protein YIPF1-like [Oppia nitens]|uniref:protein YIPF1-like n=1 Tax=Oppia nitens TaxID=1686743 RepID=UPI0023D9E8D7|nr:protein YIPF1-like [Oppia nitens]XP_054162027.1 protein YIPF1-like [Oppia nitens]